MRICGTETGFYRRIRAILIGAQNSHLAPWRIRLHLLRKVGLRIGANTYIEPNINLASGKVEIGQNTYVSVQFLIDGMGPVTIGSNVRIGPSVKLLTSTHLITENPSARASLSVQTYPTFIEDGVWLGGGCTVLPNVRIRRGCVIGAGTLVTKDTEENGLYLGVPAKRVRDLPTSSASF